MMQQRAGSQIGYGLIPVLALAAFQALSGQQQPDALPNPISAPGSPWGFDGFVVDTPAEGGWNSMAKDAHYAELTKQFASGVYGSAFVDAHRVGVEVQDSTQLLALTREIQTAVPDPAMELADYLAEPVVADAAMCVRFSIKFDNLRSTSLAPSVLFARGISCARPGSADLVITLKYVLRGPAVDLVPGADKVADSFLASLRFAPSDPSLLRRARVAAGQTPEESMQLLLPQAERGDGEAALLLGDMYLYGRGVPRDYRAARKWFEIAARDGRAEALFNLGAIYDKALGVERDPAQAIAWFTLAADQRDADAQLNLALFFIKGDGVPKNLAAAEQWLQRSANNGNTRARRILAEGKYKQL